MGFPARVAIENACSMESVMQKGIIYVPSSLCSHKILASATSAMIAYVQPWTLP